MKTRNELIESTLQNLGVIDRVSGFMVGSNQPKPSVFMKRVQKAKTPELRNKIIRAELAKFRVSNENMAGSSARKCTGRSSI